MKDTFSSYHPVVNFTYFAAVIVFGMFFLHPYFLIFSFFCPFIYSIILNGGKALRFNLLFLLPLMVAAALINPLFNHAGVTILAYFPDGNPVTRESLLYGVAAAAMFGSVILWFSCYHAVMSSDKFIYLFGRVFPAQSLLLSMTLRFAPRYQAQIKTISQSQKCIGRSISDKGILHRAKHGLRILSIMTTWALENAIETADSMKSRGYGLPGRTSFSIFRFDGRDRAVFIIMLCLIAAVIWGTVSGENSMLFFPSVRIPALTLGGILARFSYSALCLLPLIINAAEEIKWMHIKSQI